MTRPNFFRTYSAGVHSASSLRESLLAAVVEHTPECVKLIDEEGTLLDMNPAGLALIEADDWESVRGANVYDLVTPEHKDRFKAFNASVLAGNEERLQFEIIGLKGTRRWMDSTAVPLVLPGMTTVHLAITRDITADKRKEQELRIANRNALSASRAKSEFLANMSHEIRTPMTAILGYTEILLGQFDADSNPTDIADALLTIKRNGEHLLSVINDILDMSKIESRKLTVEQIPVSPSDVIHEVVSLLQVRAQSKGLTIDVRYDTSIPATILSDATRLRQILLNLVGNALKFTEVGRVTIRVSYNEADQSMSIQVQDTGIGMTPQHREVIAQFGAFSQADTSTTRKFGGTGLGLRISNSLAKMLGGTIQIESELGVGSTFTLMIAAPHIDGERTLTPEVAVARHAMRPAPQTPCSAEATTDRPLRGIRILLAEDGPDNQRLISFFLKKAGAEVQVVENGQLALDSMIASMEHFTPPDAVLMDMQMPVLDGYQTTAALRKVGYDGPIIALTAHAMNEDRQKCLDAGCDDYATKPIDRAKLIGLIATCTAHSTQRTA